MQVLFRAQITLACVEMTFSVLAGITSLLAMLLLKESNQGKFFSSLLHPCYSTRTLRLYIVYL